MMIRSISTSSTGSIISSVIPESSCKQISKQSPSAVVQLRRASAFVPGRGTSLDQVPVVPKPPSTNWFTANPNLLDSYSALDDLIHRTRQQLYDLRVLKRFSAPADFSGTGVRLKWLKWKLHNQPRSEADTGLLGEEEKRMLHVLWNPRMRWQDIKAMGDMIHGSEGRKLKMMEYREAISKLNELRSLKRYVIMVKNLDLNQNPLNELDSELDQALLRYSRPEDQASSSKDRDVGRDHLGRFYGIGKKKESTARVWMIEVKLDNSETFRKTGDDQTQETDLIQDSSERLGETDQEIKQTDADKNHLHFGKVLVNGRPISDYFNTSRLRAAALRPLEITNSIGHYNIHILTHGGGKMGQAAAVSHGLAVAMMKALTEASKTDSSIQERYFKKVLVRSSLTVRDPRVVERKKTGKPGARSSYRWVKR